MIHSPGFAIENRWMSRVLFRHYGRAKYQQQRAETSIRSPLRVITRDRITVSYRFGNYYLERSRNRAITRVATPQDSH